MFKVVINSGKKFIKSVTTFIKNLKPLTINELRARLEKKSKEELVRLIEFYTQAITKDKRPIEPGYKKSLERRQQIDLINACLRLILKLKGVDKVMNKLNRGIEKGSY